MDEQSVLPPDFPAYLPCGFEEGLALYVADRAAYFGQHDIRARLFPDGIDILLYRAGDMRDDLHRLAEILSPPLALDHLAVHLAGGEIGEFVEVLVDEPLVMSEVEIRLRTVLGDEHFTVLAGVHRPGIHIDIGVELLRRHLVTARPEQPAERRGDYAFTQPRDNSSRDENILCHVLLLRGAHPPQFRLKNEKRTLSVFFSR